MNVLIIKNIATEGPGTIEDHLRAENIPYSIVDMNKGEKPLHPDAFTHLVVMGGPMAVYEMHRHPYLIDESLLINTFIRANKHVLGVCLGAQMVAHVLGARVYPGKQKEIGWYEVSLTNDGMSDPLISQLRVPGKNVAQVFQWHGDTFDLPPGAVRVASSPVYPNQAFRYADRVYALQFHIEVTPTIVRDWLSHEKGIDFKTITGASDRIFGPYLERATMFYRGFFTE
jgi:GMP synthase (glutamine-hydrolysing)